MGFRGTQRVLTVLGLKLSVKGGLDLNEAQNMSGKTTRAGEDTKKALNLKRLKGP